jgi:ethanolamine utilization cobalamin adenosyltransferase
MRVITEADLRLKFHKNNDLEICLRADDFLTQAAKDYIRDKGLKVTISDDKPNYKIMGQENIEAGGSSYIDSEGNSYNKKPEHMTALHGNLLVPKSHPRIAFRGKMDTLQGKILEAQVIADRNNYPGAVSDLEEILKFTRDILASEVKETPLDIPILIGLDDESLRNVSHNPQKYYGINHYVPHYKMGETIIVLNSVRTIVRETELAGIRAFKFEDGSFDRPDLIKALNRVSSAVYIISCRLLANYY